MKITAALIQRTEDLEILFKILKNLEDRSWNLFNFCRDTQMIWERADFVSLQNRWELTSERIESLGGRVDYSFGDAIC